MRAAIGFDRSGSVARTPRARLRRVVLGSVCVAAGLAVVSACAPMPVPLDPVPLTVTEHLVDGDVPGVSFARSADVLGDDRPELVVSRFGQPTTAPGTVTIYVAGDDLDSWTEVPVVTAADGIRFPNDTEIADLDGDGLADVIVSGGFFSCSFGPTGCGSLQWFRQGPEGVFTRHDIVQPDNSRFYHRAIVSDVDGDGITDLVTVGETFTSARTEWYRGTADSGADRFEAAPRVIGPGGGSLPVVHDIDGDGDEDVLSPQFFAPGPPVIWFERLEDPSPADPAGVWQRHTLATAGLGKGFEFELVEDLRGDGVDRWVGTNHQNTWFDPTTESAVLELTPGADPTQPWAATTLSEGIQSRPRSPTTLAPGLLGAGDVDLDGRTDLVVSGDGDDRLFVMLQQPDGSFTTTVLDSDMGQAGGAEVTDMDGDGAPEALFTSYEQGVVVLYEFAP